MNNDKSTTLFHNNQLLGSEERTQAMLDATPLACNFWDEHFQNIDCNLEAAKLFGLRDKKEYLERFFDLSPEYQPSGEPSTVLAAQYIQTAFDTGYCRFEWMHQKLDGEPIPSEITLVRVKFGDRYMVAGYTRDLREFKQMLKETREADERTRLMLDAMPLCCNLWNDQGENLDCNMAAVKLFGLESKQEYLSRFFELSPEYQPCGGKSEVLANQHIQAAFKEGYQRFEWMHQLLNGSPLPAEITLVRIKWRDSYIVAGYTRDLRELKTTLSKLDSERALLGKILNSSPICFTILVNNVVRYATPFDESFLGLKVGENFEQYFASESDHVDMKAELRQYGAINWCPTNLRTKDGTIKNMLANAFFADYYGEKALMLWLVDVTAMREVEEGLRYARDVAEQSAQAKSFFLANMSHEIRTPMNAILGMTNLALHTDLTPKQYDYIKKAEIAAKSLLRIINDILDFSKIEAGKLEMEKIPFDLTDVILGIRSVMNERLTEKKLSFITNTKIDLPETLSGDPLRLHQILLNLVSNAIKFTKEGSIALNVRVKEKSYTKATLLFSITDTGIGMAPEQVNELFSPFMQADSSTTRKYGGTGLGLAICKDLVSMMDGRIWCESELNVGTTFFFTAQFDLMHKNVREMPASSAPPSTLSHPQETLQKTAKEPKDVRILLVEDNEVNQMVALELLKMEGYGADVANNGKEAIEKTDQKQYDIIFMDIQMPEMDGLTATAEIRRKKEYIAVPIIAMTAHAMAGDREISLTAGMNDHITKPIDADLLYETLLRWT